MAKKKIVFFVILIAAILSLLFLPGYTRLQDAIARYNELEKQIAGLKKSITSLSNEKKQLESDITYIEKIAREKMGLIKKGEMVVELEE